MTMGHHHTATILPFPGRAQKLGAASGLGAKPAGKSGITTNATQAKPIGFMDSWYHQAAIDGAPQSNKP